jgi:hypothetical protein
MFNVNQITSELAKMADPMLQKYAAMHKNDPYTVALAVGESNRRKAIRTAAQGRAAGQQQPKVVDQDIAEMSGVNYADAMGNMTGALPENMGIGRLPAPNMQAMGKAEGGIIGYADRGAVRTPPEVAIKDFIEKYAQEYKVDSALLTQIVGVESGKKAAEAKNPKSSAHGVGQLVDTMWEKMGGGERTNPEVQVRNAAKLLRSNTDSFTKANGRPPDPSEAYTTWFLGDPTGRAVLRADPNASVEDVIRKADPKGADRIIKANASVLQDKKVGDVMRWTQGKMAPVMGANTPVPFGSTQAEPAAQAAPAGSTQDMMSRIPTGGVPGAGPTPAKPQEVGFLSPEDIEKKFGLSPDTARNVYNTMMAPTPIAPASRLPKTPGYVSKAVQGVAGLGEKLYNKVVPTGKISEEGIAALQAQRAAERALEAEKATQLRLTPPAAPLPQGAPPVSVTQAGQGIVQSAEDLEKVRLANQAADRLAASQTAARATQVAGNAPSAAEKIQTASLLREADEAARLTQAARAATNTKTGVATTQIPGGVGDLLKSTPIDMGDLEATDRSLGQVQPTPEVKKIEEEAPVSDGKTTGGGGLSSLLRDPAFLMGMRLMANKNPNLFGAVGEAGIGTVGDLAAAEKASSESEYRKSMGKYYGSYADAIERGAKEKNEVQLAEKSAQEALDTWAKNNKMALLQSPDLYDRMRNKYRIDAYNVYGIKMPTMAAGAPDAAGGGFKLLGVRPG